MNIIKIIKDIICILAFTAIALLLFLVNNNKTYKIDDNLKEKYSIAEIIKKQYLNQDFPTNNKLISLNEIKEKIENKELLDNIEKYKMNGCFKIIDNHATYYNEVCQDIIIDKNISSNPIILENSIPVKFENGEYIKSNLIDWYDYENKEFAIIAVGNFNKKYEDGEIIEANLIKNVFIWIPSFYYIETSNTFSYKSLGESNPNDHYKYTTSNLLPFAFYYKNRKLYGMWIQIDNNPISLISNRGNVDIHTRNEDDKKVIEIFENYYNTKIINNINDSYRVISVGQGDFFNG